MDLRIGDIAIRSVTELQTAGGTRFVLPQATPEAIRPIAWLQPHFATPEGRLIMAVQTFLVEAAGRKIIIDTGIGHDKSGRMVPAWNGRKDDFLDRMAAAGFGPDDVDVVVNTHLHVDHCGFNTSLRDGAWVPTFAKARYVTGRREFDYWSSQTVDPEHVQVFKDSVAPVAEAKQFDFVEDGDEILPGVSFISTPGHSVGHMSVRLTSGGREAILGGDVMHHVCQMTHPDWSSTPDFDPAQSARTRRAFFGMLAGTDTILVAAHAPDGRGGRVVRDGEGYRLDLAG